MGCRWMIAGALMLVFADGNAQVAADFQDFHDVEERLGEVERDRRTGDEQSTIRDRLGTANTVIGSAVAAGELYEEWSTLDASEADCGSAYQNAGPSIPSACGENGACTQCYTAAVQSIDFNRYYIERARCITEANVKMAKKATAFGDSTSGIHGVMGLSWQLQGKPPIEEAVKSLKKTYTEKAGQYLTALERSLTRLGECEARFLGNPDWFERYGWIYLTFMKSKYASAPE